MLLHIDFFVVQRDDIESKGDRLSFPGVRGKVFQKLSMFSFENALSL